MSRDTFDSDEPELEQIRDLVKQARALALAGDRAGLTSLATVIWRRVHEPLLALTQDMDDVVGDVETVYDIAFPPPEGSMPADPEARFQRIADVLDAPWPTPRRDDLLESMLAQAGTSLDTLAQEAISAPPSPGRTRLLRLLVCSRLSQPRRRTLALVLEAIHATDGLDIETVEAAFTAAGDPTDVDRLGDVLFGAGAQRFAPDFLVALREQFDEVVWRLTATPNPDDWHATPEAPAPRGLRFVLRGLDLWAGRLPAAPGHIDEDYYRRKLIEYLCAAELTDDELIELADRLQARPDAERNVATAGQPSLAVATDAEPPRLAPTSADPVGDALAAAGEVVSRYPDEEIAPSELRELIRVHETDPSKWHGLNTYLWFDDDCGQYADFRTDGLALALADQPGVEEVNHMDREVVLVRTSLALADVHAAAIRALLEINRRPRLTPEPEPRPSAEALSGLATSAAPTLAAYGFAGRLRIVLGDEPSGVHGFYRICEERLIQVVRLWPGLGEMTDGTSLDGTVSVVLGLYDIPTIDPAESIRQAGDREFPQGTVVASWEKRAVAPNTEAVARVLVDEGLPWFDTVNSREVIVREWVRHPSWHGPPYNLWEKAEVAARWGMRQEASELLRYGHHRQEQHRPKFAAVAEKYGL